MGYPYIMSENLSNEYFSAANSSKKGLYFSSDVDVLFEAKAIGCKRVTSLPPGSVDLIFCDKTPANASLLVLGSPVSGLQKDRDWTGPRPVRTGNSQDCRRLQLQSSLRSLKILEISRPTKDWS